MEPKTYTIDAAAYHAVLDGIVAESESLRSHQPGPAGCVEASKRLEGVADQLRDAIATGDAIAEGNAIAPETTEAPEETDPEAPGK